MAAKRTSAPAAAVTRDAGPRPTARTPSRLQYVSGLLIDYAQLLCIGAAILVVQLAVLLPPLRRLLSQLYERAASDSERVEEQAARGLISAEARGRHYVFKSIDFDDFLRPEVAPFDQLQAISLHQRIWCEIGGHFGAGRDLVTFDIDTGGVA